MRFIKLIIFSILSIIFFLLSILLVLGGMMAADHELTARIIHVITRIEDPITFVIGGFFVLIIGLIFYNRAGKSPERSDTFVFEAEKGRIEVSLNALEDYIIKHFAQKPVVHNVKARVGTSRDGKKLRVRALISVWSEQNLKTAGETVQQEIAGCLREGLGLDNVETVVVSVDKIIAAKTSRPVSSNVPNEKKV
jgi:hypothetical protein